MTLEEAQITIDAGDAADSTTEDVIRCLKMLYSAHPGEQALDRDFGIDTDAVSLPMDSAKAMIAAEIVAKTATYEPRARVSRVTWDEAEAANGQLKPRVVIRLV